MKRMINYKMAISHQKELYTFFFFEGKKNGSYINQIK